MSSVTENRPRPAVEVYRTHVASRRRKAVCAALSSFIARFGCATPAHAQPETAVSSAVRIECAVLGVEGAAALEARARAEMASDPDPAGQIAVECADGSAVVTWRPEGSSATRPDDRQTLGGPSASRLVGGEDRVGGGTRERTVVLDLDPGAAVDTLLAAIHALRSDHSPASATSDLSSSRRSETIDVRGAMGVAAPASFSTPPRSSTEPSRLRRRSYRFGVTAGIEGELWHGDITGAVGPRFGLRLSTQAKWSTAVVAGVAWSATTSGGIHARALRATWTVGYSPVAPFEISGGGEALVLEADSSGAASVERSGATAAGVAQARCVLRFGAFVLAMGPGLEWLARPIAVEVAGSELFRVPVLVGGFSIDGEGDLLW